MQLSIKWAARSAEGSGDVLSLCAASMRQDAALEWTRTRSALRKGHCFSHRRKLAAIKYVAGLDSSPRFPCYSSPRPLWVQWFTEGARNVESQQCYMAVRGRERLAETVAKMPRALRRLVHLVLLCPLSKGLQVGCPSPLIVFLRLVYCRHAEFDLNHSISINYEITQEFFFLHLVYP